MTDEQLTELVYGIETEPAANLARAIECEELARAMWESSHPEVREIAKLYRRVAEHLRKRADKLASPAPP